MFRVQAPIARALIRKLCTEDVELAYRELMRTFAESRFSPDHSNGDYNSRSLATLARVFSTLNEFVGSRSETTPSPATVAQPERRPHGRFFSGQVPPRPMRFGSFLYYSGRISDSDLNEALTWQRTQRPLFGQLAMRNEMLTACDFSRVLVYTGKEKTFGQVARKMKVLTASDTKKILSHQSTYNCPIGRYFVEKNILSDTDLAQMLQNMSNHNRACTGVNPIR